MAAHDGQFSQPQLDAFDEAYAALVSGLEDVALASLSLTLCERKQAPPILVEQLTCSEQVGVAGPMLQYFKNIPEALLIKVAHERSEPFLERLACRPDLSTGITDVLVDRGSERILELIIDNETAHFSSAGLRNLSDRVAELDALALKLANRPDLPRHIYLHMVASASQAVKLKLGAKGQGNSNRVEAVLSAITERVASHGQNEAWNFSAAAKNLVASNRHRQIDEATIAQQIELEDYAATVAAISIAGSLPTTVVHAILKDPSPDDTVILAKALALRWQTTKQLMALKVATHDLDEDFRSALQSHAHTSQMTARKLLRRRSDRFSRPLSGPTSSSFGSNLTN